MEKPIQITTKSKQNKWQITEEARRILESTDQPVIVIGIVGNYRTGKSYLLNRLAGILSGFTIGSTVQAETKGIWMWMLSHPTQANRKLILLDTEGLNDIEKENQEKEDLLLFCLVILLSSVVVFNVKENLKGDFIQTLHLVSQLSDNIKAGKDASDDYLCQYFPKLVVLIRDLELELKIQGREVSPQEYFEHSLQLKPGSSLSIANYNIPRECVRKFFPGSRRQCFSLPRPIENAEDVRHLGKRETKTSQIFESDFKRFKDDLFALAEPMQFHATVLTGRAYINFADGLITSINDNELPNIESTITTMAVKDGQRALEKGLAEYQNAIAVIESRMPISEQELNDHHCCLRQNALRVFEAAITLKRTESYEDFLTRFQHKIKDSYERLLTNNRVKSNEVCKSEIKRLFENLESRISKGEFSCKGGCKLFMELKNQAVSTYNAMTNLGPEKLTCLETYLEGMAKVQKSIISADEALTEKEREKEIEKENARRADAKRKQTEEDKQLLEKRAKQRETEHNELLEKVKRQHDEEMEVKKRESEQLLATKDSEIENMKRQGLAVDKIKMERDNLEKDYERLLKERSASQEQYERLGRVVLEGEQNYQIARAVGGFAGAFASSFL